jgi:hypothetical protein
MSFSNTASPAQAFESAMRQKRIAELESALRQKRIAELESALRQKRIAELESALRQKRIAELESALRQKQIVELESALRQKQIAELEAKLVESKAKSATMKKVHFGDEFHCLIPKLQHGIKPKKRGDFVEQLLANASTTVYVDGVCLSFYEQYEQSLNELTGTGIHPESGQWILKEKFEREEKEANDCDKLLGEQINTQRQSNMEHWDALKGEAYAIEKQLAEAGRALRGNPTVLAGI